MRLTPMRFKDFTWPHNPEIYTVEHRRRMAVLPVPFGRCVLQDLGGACRVLRGEGAFAGPEACRQFQALAEVFRQTGPGLLIHPVWQAERAYFVTLEVTEEPLPDYVRYQFEFWEDWNGYAGGLKETAGSSEDAESAPAVREERRVYRVRQGDSLWAIARQQGVTLAALIQANPQIKNPNLIYPGQEVTLP